MRHVTRAFTHPSRAKMRQIVADHCGVTVARLMDVIAKRKAYKQARYFRLWKRRKAVKVRGRRPRNLQHKPDAPYAQEGELHLMLRAVGLSGQEFCRMMGMSYGTFKGWYGTALYDWPLELMRYYGWSKNMADYLRSVGKDPEQFQPQLPKANRPGMYPRKNGDLVLEEGRDYSPFTVRP